MVNNNNANKKSYLLISIPSFEGPGFNRHRLLDNAIIIIAEIFLKW